MRYLLALSFILASAGVPAVATYFPLQTYAMMSAIKSASGQVAAVFASQEESVAPAASQAPAAAEESQIQPTPSRPEDWDVFPPQLI